MNAIFVSQKKTKTKPTPKTYADHQTLKWWLQTAWCCLRLSGERHKNNASKQKSKGNIFSARTLLNGGKKHLLLV